MLRGAALLPGPGEAGGSCDHLRAWCTGGQRCRRGRRRYEEAFTRALSRGDVAVVTWLCCQLDPAILSQVPRPPPHIMPLRARLRVRSSAQHDARWSGGCTDSGGRLRSRSRRW